jgi:hypothetical protein
MTKDTRDTILGIVFLIWCAFGLWCGYFLYCLMQVPPMNGYHMFG